MSKWQEKTKRPVLPVYMAALVWPIMALLVPIYTLGGLVLTAAVSAGAYFAGTKLCPTRVVRTYVPYATGSEDVDAMLTPPLPADNIKIIPFYYRTKSVHLQPSARKNGAKAAPHAACSRAGDQAALAGLVLGSTAAGRWVRGSAYFA